VNDKDDCIPTKAEPNGMVLAPAVSGVPLTCSTSMSGAMALAVREITKGFSSKSLFAIRKLVLAAPAADGTNVTVNVVLAPGATVVAMAAVLT